jgi:diguanylate cyclase (GGDEF)-like protein
MMVRLLFSGGTRNAAFRMLLGALVGLSVSDIGWAVFSHIGQPPGPTAQRLLAMSFQGAYILVAAAALHPAVRGVAVSGGRRESHLSPLLLIGLTTAVLVPPALLAVEATDKKVGDGLAIAMGSTVLCLLVIARLAQLLRQVEAQSRQLRDLATIDELTGLPNRRAWSLDLPATMEHARIEETALAVAMIDLDHFKRFNDTYGHPAGDQLLRAAAINWRGHLRPVDRLARYGGEEFIVLLPVIDADDALVVLERLRVVTPSGQTFSAGVALWDRIESPAQLIARADRALYQAKTSGRNRSVLFSETTAEVPAVQIGGQSGA